MSLRQFMYGLMFTYNLYDSNDWSHRVCMYACVRERQCELLLRGESSSINMMAGSQYEWTHNHIGINCPFVHRYYVTLDLEIEFRLIKSRPNNHYSEIKNQYDCIVRLKEALFLKNTSTFFLSILSTKFTTPKQNLAYHSLFWARSHTCPFGFIAKQVFTLVVVVARSHSWFLV